MTGLVKSLPSKKPGVPYFSASTIPPDRERANLSLKNDGTRPSQTSTPPPSRAAHASVRARPEIYRSFPINTVLQRRQRNRKNGPIRTTAFADRKSVGTPGTGAKRLTPTGATGATGDNRHVDAS